jgi:hypothetical protein
MRSFDIRPYLGALPIIFGMTRAEVHALVGVPHVSSPPTPWRGISDSWEGGNPSIGYDEKETVTHIGFGPGDFSLGVRQEIQYLRLNCSWLDLNVVLGEGRRAL